MPPVPKKKSKRGLHLKKPVVDVNKTIQENRQSPTVIELVVDSNAATEDMSSITLKPVVDVNMTIQEDKQSPIVIEHYSPRKVYWPETEEALPELEIEVVRLPGTYDRNLKNITGKRIVDISHFIGEIRSLEKHECHVKSTGYLAFEKEIKFGLNSKLCFKCSECREQRYISTNPENDSANINLLATWSTIGTGQGYSSLEESLSLLDIPPLDNKTFLKYQQELGNTWHECLTESILDAGKEEYQRAIDTGNIVNETVGQCSVIVDAGWSHRSYGHKYTAKSGVACIIGAYTKKLLFVGMRNKYCSICSIAAQKHNKAPSHTCYKNWSGSSPAMEADIILEGFLQSESMHNLQYTTFIGDGDSSVHAKLLENVPYCREIKKIECANHLTKNLTKHLHGIAKESLTNKKLLPTTRINHIGKTCRKLITIHAKKDNPSSEHLKADLQNVVEHVFANHEHCKIDYCLKHGQVSTENSLKQAPTETRLRIFRILGNFASHSSSLVKDVTSNRCEQFMHQVAKFNKGKQTFYGRRNSFNIRCNAASLAYQFGPSWFLKAYRRKFAKTPSKTLKRLVNKRSKKNVNLKKCRRRLFATKVQTSNAKRDYGIHCQKPDLHEEEIKKLIDQQIGLLDVSFVEADEIEQSTRGQSNNPKWFEERQSRLTASTFGDICKRRLYFGKLVETIMYKKLPSLVQLEYGKINEDVAIKAYTYSTKNIVTPCGLFVCTDKGYGFLGASPDGLVGEDKIIEIKCPYSAREYTPLGAASSIKNFCCYLAEDKCNMYLKKNHKYFYQVQGQLYISKRSYCDFVIWTPKGLHIQTIEYDEKFTKAMINKIRTFFWDHYAMELVDSRRSRNMALRDYSK